MTEVTSEYETGNTENIQSESAEDATEQFVAFTIGDQIYCVDIMSVREIRAWAGITSLPNAAEFVRGVINLRGVIVPIIDMRARFGQGLTDTTKAHVVVIVAVQGKLNGLLVDGVSDILTVHAADILPVPETAGDAETPYLEGLITQEEKMVALIGLDRLIGHAEAISPHLSLSAAAGLDNPSSPAAAG